MGGRAGPGRPPGTDPYAPRQTALELQRDSEALLLLIPDAGGRGKGVLSGKVFEYLAAERPILAAVPPDGAAAELIRETERQGDRAAGRRRGAEAGAHELHDRFANGGLPATQIPEETRYRLSRARAEELASGPALAAMTASTLTRATPGPVVDALFSRPSSRSRSRSCSGGRRAHSASPTSSRRSSWSRLLARGSEPATGGSPGERPLRLFFLGFLAVYLIGFFNLDTEEALAQWAKGMVSSSSTSSSSSPGSRTSRAGPNASTGGRSRPSWPASPRTRSTGSSSSGSPRWRTSTSTSRCSRRSRAARARSTSTERSRAERLPAECAHRRPEPSGSSS